MTHETFNFQDQFDHYNPTQDGILEIDNQYDEFYTDLDPDLEPLPDSDPEPLPDSDPEPLPDSDPESLPDSDPESLPDSDPEPLPDPDPESETCPKYPKTFKTTKIGSNNCGWPCACTGLYL